jgi:hypothetical protein
MLTLIIPDEGVSRNASPFKLKFPDNLLVYLHKCYLSSEMIH